ncbi:putative cysteine proteinase [Trichinella pseudospiralis]
MWVRGGSQWLRAVDDVLRNQGLIHWSSLADRYRCFTTRGQLIKEPLNMFLCMPCWSILLSAYDYNLIYSPQMKLGNADAFS